MRQDRAVRFRDREETGHRLADRLTRYRDKEPIVLALPRGGVPVAAPIAAALAAPLEVFIARKVGAPVQPELGVGAVAEGGVRWRSEDALSMLGISDDEFARLAEREEGELRLRVERYRGARPFPQLRGRTAILVDDGLATGGTARAALEALRLAGTGPLGPRRAGRAAGHAALARVRGRRGRVPDGAAGSSPLSDTGTATSTPSATTRYSTCSGQNDVITKSSARLAGDLAAHRRRARTSSGREPSWSRVTSMSRVSPGPTWRRKRALSIPPKSGSLPR